MYSLKFVLSNCLIKIIIRGLQVHVRAALLDLLLYNFQPVLPATVNRGSGNADDIKMFRVRLLSRDLELSCSGET